MSNYSRHKADGFLAVAHGRFSGWDCDGESFARGRTHMRMQPHDENIRRASFVNRCRFSGGDSGGGCGGRAGEPQVFGGMSPPTSPLLSAPVLPIPPISNASTRRGCVLADLLG